MDASQIAKTCIVVCAIFANLAYGVRTTDMEQLAQSQIANHDAVLGDRAGDHVESNHGGSDHFFPISVAPLYPSLQSLAPFTSIARFSPARPSPSVSGLPPLRGTFEDAVTRSIEDLSFSKDWLNPLASGKKDEKKIFQMYEVEEMEFKLANVRAEFLRKAYETMKKDTADGLEKVDASRKTLQESEKKIDSFLAGKVDLVEASGPLRDAYRSLKRTQQSASEATTSEWKAFVDFESELSTLGVQSDQFIESFESFRLASVALREAYEAQQSASKVAFDALESLVKEADEALSAYKSLKVAASDSREKMDALAKEKDAFLEAYRHALESSQ